MSATCHDCDTEIAEPVHTQMLVGVGGVTATVSIYRCGCGRVFTTIQYEPGPAATPARHRRATSPIINRSGLIPTTTMTPSESR
jgi:hypothetical protein